ncbi:NADH-quinone oxidoreductase subunit A [Leadbetterella byssophila]|jgi:NADH-quinone oxidoreductase subunit A|uniref:NADH-quinone oxidoreductase subunit A n=1 Tax=Leadbetterella byssophila (strain DSM 17132 / JCM 16389 / KACC 11308 / NBRC 106382 / 4M15) TaxID=649349 RepID=E4RVX1_LEAB4|nr:NADH-quinone oxidoreductase subunit A [Leadbetterella byssophila]ADQ18881.1 NADH dehydrogenase subunit A [Leadbetterella byssophila DSM 17132]
MSVSVPQDYLPLLIQLVLALGFVVMTLIATHYLGPKLRSKKKDLPFECGVESVGDARMPLNVRYFLTAILFVLFDVEVIFMYPWAVNFKGLGWLGFYEMLLFVAFLMAGFYYVIKKGVLDWEKE